MPSSTSSLVMHRPSTPFSCNERLQRGDVEPAAAARAAGDRAELVAALGEPGADVVGELGGERTGAHARRVGLDDAEHVVEHLRADAAARRGRAGEAVRAGDVRIGAVVDVEQRALRAFEQQRLAARARLLDQRRRRRRPSARARGASASVSSRVVANGTGVALEVVAQHEVVVLEQRLELRGEALGIEQVLHAQRAARDLVLVGGADAAAGGADLRRRPSRSRAPGRARRGYGSTSGHAGEILSRERTSTPARLELADLLQQRRRRQHDAVADVDRARSDAGCPRE